MLRLLLFLQFVFLSFFTFSAIASNHEESGETLFQALKETYQYNPTLEAARAELKATHESLPQAMAGWKPNASASTGINVADISGGDSGTATGSTEKDVSLNLSQPLFRGGSTFAATKAAYQEIQAARYRLLNTEQDILLLAVTAYMDVIRDQALVDLSQKNRDVISRQLDATEDRFEVGELTKTDVSQAKARLAEAEANLITAKGTLKSSQAEYERVVGYRPDALKEPDFKLELPATLDDALEVANNKSPSVLEAEFDHARAEKEVDQIFGELLPSVDLTAGWNRLYDPQPGLTDEQTTSSAGITATIPLYQSGSVRSRIREAKQRANQDYVEILQARRDARDSIISAWEDLEASKAEINAREAQVEAASIAREGVYEEEQVGTRTVLDTLDADQELLDAEVSFVIARRNEVVATFGLAAGLGYLTPQYLGFPEVEKNYDAHLNAVKTAIFSISADPSGDE